MKNKYKYFDKILDLIVSEYDKNSRACYFKQKYVHNSNSYCTGNNCYAYSQKTKKWFEKHNSPLVCPYCGCLPEVVKHNEAGHDVYNVCCLNLECNKKSIGHKEFSYEKAIDSWNDEVRFIETLKNNSGICYEN